MTRAIAFNVFREFRSIARLTARDAAHLTVSVFGGGRQERGRERERKRDTERDTEREREREREKERERGRLQ